MDGKLNIEAEKMFEKLGVRMSYNIMRHYYSGELLYKRMLLDILMKNNRSKIIIESDNVEKFDIINNNCKVYKIISSNSDKIYIGSTRYEIEDRLNKHVLDYEFYEKNRYKYCSSYEVIRCGVYKVLLLEDNINELDLLRKESEYIKLNIENCVNIVDPLSRKKLYDNLEEKNERRLQRCKHMIKIVIKDIIDNNLVVDSMDKMYNIYIKNMKYIMESKKRIDNDYYMILLEFTRLKNICIYV
jgi:hypothetical protein